MSPPSFARPLGQHFQFPASFKQPAFDPKARKNRPEACLGPCVDGSRLSRRGSRMLQLFGRGSHVFGLYFVYLPETRSESGCGNASCRGNGSNWPTFTVLKLNPR